MRILCMHLLWVAALARAFFPTRKIPLIIIERCQALHVHLHRVTYYHQRLYGLSASQAHVLTPVAARIVVTFLVQQTTYIKF